MHFEEWTREQQDKARVGNPFHTAVWNVQRSDLSVQHQKHPEGLSIPRFLRLALSFWLSMSEMGSENLHFWHFPGDAAGLLPGDAPRDHTLRIIALGNEKLLKGFKPRNNTVRFAFIYLKSPWKAFNSFRGKNPQYLKSIKMLLLCFKKKVAECFFGS